MMNEIAIKYLNIEAYCHLANVEKLLKSIATTYAHRLLQYQSMLINNLNLPING